MKDGLKHFDLRVDVTAKTATTAQGSYRVEALALNFFDIVQRLGVMPSFVAGHPIPAPLGGYDFAAVGVTEIFGMGGQMSEYLPSSSEGAPGLLSALRPRNLPALEAAALPTVSLTVSMA